MYMDALGGPSITLSPLGPCQAAVDCPAAGLMAFRVPHSPKTLQRRRAVQRQLPVDGSYSRALDYSHPPR